MLSASHGHDDCDHDWHDDDEWDVHGLPLPVQTDGTSGSDSGGPGEAPLPLGQTFALNSNPGAEHVIYLDFDGHVTSNTIWNSNYNNGQNISTPAYSFEGDDSFTDAELERIQWIWQRVSEDFRPFDVNVTTEEPSSADLIKSGSGDHEWGVRIVIGGNGSWFGSGGGVAYLNSFNWSSDTPAFVFENNLGNGNERYTAEAISHEAGHVLGLRHDGRTSPSETYYGGHGSGETGWAPIMGVGYYKQLTQWSRGEYANADQLEDDLAIIVGNNGFGYRADDHGDTTGSASLLAISNGYVDHGGIIETNSDVDVFELLTGTGTLDLDIQAFERGPNLDIGVALYDANFNLLTSVNPESMIDAQLTWEVSDGQYFVSVTGVGKGDPLADGYSDYGSLGSFSITGTVPTSTSTLLDISSDQSAADEGDLGTTSYTFTVDRSGDLSSGTTVDYSVAGTGSSPAAASDFDGGIFASGTVSFAAGEAQKQITVLVAGDTVSESDETFAVTLSNASGSATILNDQATSTIRNDDTGEVLVTPTTGLVTSERGGSDTFDVVLGRRPDADVTIHVASLDTTEGTVDQSTLTFTPQNWDSVQTVTVNGVDDSVRDRNVVYTIDLSVTSDDTAYDGLDVSDVEVTNQDNEKGRGGGGGGGNGGGGNGGGGGKGKKKSAAIETPAVVQAAVPKASTETGRSEWRPDEMGSSGESSVDIPTDAGAPDDLPPQAENLTEVEDAQEKRDRDDQFETLSEWVDAI